MENPTKTPSKTNYHQSKKMLSCQYRGKEDLRMRESPVPLITDPTDVIVKVTATTICCSDLSTCGEKPGQMERGDITGHESVGIVDEVGAGIKRFKKGDRVVISSVIACGQCDHCRRKEWSCCDTTNPSKPQEEPHGHRTTTTLGYTQTRGGLDGCQAEYVRVPFADVNLFPIPNEISDKQALTVSDVATTGYHGTELADVRPGDKVLVFGCGPVGLMVQMWSKFRGADQVVAIDVDPQRLDFARKQFGSEVINPKEVDLSEAVRKILPGGPDKVIECVGSRSSSSGSLLRKFETALKMESESPDILNTAIELVRKNGRITILGDYTGYVNHFNLGAMMEKHLTMNGGQLWPQSYYKTIFDAMKSGKVDPTVLFTHTFPLSKCDEAYKLLDKHEKGMLKPYLIPDTMMSQTE
jgi:threonine dehydrogenase-like Zn-dependent dehydrogenase